jgi:hypothetical protein
MPDSPIALDQECFFVAPIGDEGHEIRRRSDGVLRFIVGRAAEELGLKAVRADEIATPGQITLQVIDHILGARTVVADLTGRNPNVFYELAIRHAARLPVALIVDRNDPPLPFDIGQMRAIRFDHTDLESADQCRQAIVAHIRQALEGAVDSPVATSIDLRTLAGGNQLERSVAKLVDRVEQLDQSQRRAERVLEQISVGGLTGDDIEFYVLKVMSDAYQELQHIMNYVKDTADDNLVQLLARIQTAIRWAWAVEGARRHGRRDGWSEEKFRDVLAQLGSPPTLGEATVSQAPPIYTIDVDPGEDDEIQ